MKKKRALAFLLTGAMAFSMVACGSQQETTNTGTSSQAETQTQAEAGTAAEGTTASEGAAAGEDISADITMWTYPIGSFGDEETVNGFIAAFNEIYPNINVSVEYLDYTSGDDQVTAAIEAGTTPDIIMEGPERLVSNWGANGKMLD